MEKIKTFLNKNFKPILFCIIFLSICFIYNQNNQNLNFFLKRGIILEYDAKNVNIKNLESKLVSLGIKYSSTKETKNSLYLALPIKGEKKDEKLINDVSEYIFDTHPNSKLLKIDSLSENYHKPFASFVKFLNILLISTFIWVFALYLFYADKMFFIKAKNDFINFAKRKKNSFITFCKNTKQNGVGYFLKRIFFDEERDENGNEKEINFIKETISTIVFVIACVILIRFFIGELRWIPSGSMRPTILEHDRVFVEKLDFPKKDIKRGDILVFYPPEETLKKDILSVFSRLSGILCKDVAFIKRAIGMPNDKFEIKFNERNSSYQVYINDIALDEPYILSQTDWSKCSEGMHCGPFVIPEGHYFMMGDNRGNSKDSRFWGLLEQERIIGRANFMFWPISRINVLNDKYIELHKEKQNNNYKNQRYIINRY